MMPRYLLSIALIFWVALESAPAAQTGTPGLKVRHIHIWVKDVERTKSFYRDKLGFKLTSQKAGENVEFEGGQLWFGKWRGSGTLDTNSITIGIGTGSVETAYQTLKKKGVSLPDPPSEAHGEWHFVFVDPDGYHIEVEGPK